MISRAQISQISILEMQMIRFGTTIRIDYPSVAMQMAYNKKNIIAGVNSAGHLKTLGWPFK